MSGVDVRVLGPVEVVGRDGPVRLAAKHRCLLAALAAAGGRSCSADELVEAIWDGDAPASAPKLVQVYVSQLRKALPEPVRILTHPGGYSVELPPNVLDASRFERLVPESAEARRQGNPALAASLAGQALSLWRGRPYADLATADFLRLERERLEEVRHVAIEERLDAGLALGRHAEVLGEILSLAAENPLRERLHEQAMLALYRCGRQSDALAHYAGVRRQLSGELGLEPGRPLRELQQRILRQDPGLDADAAADGRGAGLPEPVNPLVGRDHELAELVRMLRTREARLLVLTGAGGSGKTRLALEAARSAASLYANGTALVELAPLDDPDLLLPTIAQALGVVAEAPERSLDALAEALGARELLLVVDNAEHLQAAVHVFVELLSRAPRLTLLVTSRTVLHLSGEHVFPVPPLEADAALALFEQRARSVQPRFRLSDEDELLAREICIRVDGLPLAIEFAAARVRTLPLAALAARLGERLSVLAGGPRDLPARQQTLRATLDWSHDLLSQDEGAFLARLSVFPAGATLDAVAAVCLAPDEDAALLLVEALHDASLLTVHEGTTAMRYRLLETVRQYAAERLEQLGDEDTAERHAGWYLALAEAAEPELSGDRQTEWFATLDAEHDNLRAALVYLDERGERELHLRLSVALSRFWYVRGHLGEARRRLEEALAHSGTQPPLLLRRALTAAGAIALIQGDYDAATSFSEGALDAARQTGEPRLVANALSNLGAIVLAAGDHERAADVLAEAVALAREVGDTRIMALAINNLGDLALTTGEYERARPLFEESHALLTTRGDTANIARSLFNRGAAELMLGDEGRAEAHFRDGLALARETGDLEDMAWCLEGLAAVAVRRGDGPRASVLVGVAAGLLERMGADFKPFERQLHEQTESRAEAIGGPDAHAAARARGASLGLDEALALALAVDAPSGLG